MYISKELNKKLIPGLFGFRTHKDIFDCRANRVELSNSANKFEYSTLHFGSAYGLTESVKFINELGVSNIFEHDMKLANRLIEEFSKNINIKIISPINSKESSPIITIKCNN